mgnify:CR=1 FL=1
MPEEITLKVNGVTRTLEAEPDMPLLWALRDFLGLKGAKYGCGVGACGACTVLVNGRAMRSWSVSLDLASFQRIINSQKDTLSP